MNGLAEKLSHAIESLEKRINLRVAFGVLLLVAFLFVLPILVANTYYIDDSGRRIGGYTHYAESGRFGIEIVDRLVAFTTGLMPDIGNLLQILSIPLLAFSGWLVYRHLYMKSKRGTIPKILLAMSLVINPFILTNLSFRYDSLGMITAYLLAIYSAIILMSRPVDKKSGLFAGLMILISAMTYQPMVLMSIGVVAILFMCEAFENKSVANVISKLIFASTVFVASLMVYLVIFKLTQSPRMAADNRANIVSLDAEGLRTVWDNAVNIGELLKLYYAGSFEIIAIFGVLAIVATVLLMLKIKQTSPSVDNAAVKLVLVTLGIVILGAAIIGPFILLANPLTSMRTLASAGLVVTALLVPFVRLPSINRYLANIVMIIPMIVVFFGLSFSFIYGAALSNQRSYDRVVRDSIIDNITENYQYVKNKNVYIGRSVGMPLSVKVAQKERPILAKMNIATSNDVWFIRRSIADFNIEEINILWLRGDRCNSVIDTISKVEDGPFFTTYQSRDSYIYWFNNKQPNPRPYC